MFYTGGSTKRTKERKTPIKWRNEEFPMSINTSFIAWKSKNVNVYAQNSSATKMRFVMILNDENIYKYHLAEFAVRV